MYTSGRTNRKMNETVSYNDWLNNCKNRLGPFTVTISSSTSYIFSQF